MFTMKTCARCGEQIKEEDSDTRWGMIITKQGQKIVEFKAFHLECWKEFFEESVQVRVNDMGNKI